MLSVLWLVRPQAYAADNQVNATLCDTVSQPAVTVTDPSSLSVATNVPSLTMSGTTVRTSQIDISINGVYTSSVAVGSDETFTATVGLQQGDNTITLHAYFSCNNTSADTTVIATYNPAVTPPVDNNPGTTINQTPQGNGTVSNGNSGIQYGQGGLSSGTESSPSPKENIVDRIEHNLGIGRQSTGYRTDLARSRVVSLLIVSWLALVMAIVGIILMVIPSICLGVLSRRRRGSINSKKAKRWIRLIGLLCLVIGLGIVQI